MWSGNSPPSLSRNGLMTGYLLVSLSSLCFVRNKCFECLTFLGLCVKASRTVLICISSSCSYTFTHHLSIQLQWTQVYNSWLILVMQLDSGYPQCFAIASCPFVAIAQQLTYPTSQRPLITVKQSQCSSSLRNLQQLFHCYAIVQQSSPSVTQSCDSCPVLLHNRTRYLPHCYAILQQLSFAVTHS